jgi:hypothetical protein
MKVIAAILISFDLSSFIALAQESTAIDHERKYPFIIRDSPARLFTMRQFDQAYPSGYRLVYKEKIKINTYLREFQNRNNWFLGGGIGINDYPLFRRWTASMTVDCWSQPVNLDFNENAGKLGGAIDVTGSYDLLAKKMAD